MILDHHATDLKKLTMRCRRVVKDFGIYFMDDFFNEIVDSFSTIPLNRYQKVVAEHSMICGGVVDAG